MKCWYAKQLDWICKELCNCIKKPIPKGYVEYHFIYYNMLSMIKIKISGSLEPGIKRIPVGGLNDSSTRNCHLPKCSHHGCMYHSVSFHPCQHLASLSLAILIGILCYLIVVLICLSRMANDVESLFMCLFAIYRSSVKCLFMPLAIL